MNNKNISLIIFAIFIMSCTHNKNNNLLTNVDTAMVSKDSFPYKIEIQESVNEEDTLINDANSAHLKLIKENFKKLNSIINWTSIVEKYYDASIEGGSAKFYYQNKNLQKIITVSYGETYRKLTEYYLLNEQLSFIFEKTYRYNRPFNYDSTSMKENNDTEVFDFSKATFIEVRNYFENGKLVHQISTEKEESKDINVSTEQKRISEDYATLIKLISEP